MQNQRGGPHAVRVATFIRDALADIAREEQWEREAQAEQAAAAPQPAAAQAQSAVPVIDYQRIYGDMKAAQDPEHQRQLRREAMGLTEARRP